MYNVFIVCVFDLKIIKLNPRFPLFQREHKLNIYNRTKSCIYYVSKRSRKQLQKQKPNTTTTKLPFTEGVINITVDLLFKLHTLCTSGEGNQRTKHYPKQKYYSYLMLVPIPCRELCWLFITHLPISHHSPFIQSLKHTASTFNNSFTHVHLQIFFVPFIRKHQKRKILNVCKKVLLLRVNFIDKKGNL